MSENELRQAAERLIDSEGGIGGGFESDYVAGGFAAGDAIAVARAYLADHPADDGEPVTEEWLTEVTAHNDGGASWWVAKDGGVVWFSPDGEGDYHVTIRGPMTAVVWGRVSVRREVRAICAALGVPLQETTA